MAKLRVVRVVTTTNAHLVVRISRIVNDAIKEHHSGSDREELRAFGAIVSGSKILKALRMLIHRTSGLLDRWHTCCSQQNDEVKFCIVDEEPNMTLNRIKIISGAFLLFTFLLVVGIKKNPVVTSAAAADTATTYKAQCAMCHTPTAAKFYDPAKTDEAHIEAILKGKKGEKPPYMPAFEAKGMKPEEAKALAEYMRGLKTQ
jgi:mono/diheme cytochrome c family protein